MGGRWKRAIAPDGRSSGPYLVDAITLRRAFRKHYLGRPTSLVRSRRAEAQGRVRISATGRGRPSNCSTSWRVSSGSVTSSPPPRAGCPPETVLKYLARYLTGGPISESRIVSADDHHVTFMALEGKVVGGERKQVPITLTLIRITRLWSIAYFTQGLHQDATFWRLVQSPLSGICPALRPALGQHRRPASP